MMRFPEIHKLSKVSWEERDNQNSVIYIIVIQSVSPNSLLPHQCSIPGFPVLHYLAECAQTHVHWVGVPSNHLILCHSLLLLPSIFPSIKVFSNESVLRSGGQSIEASSSASVLPVNIQGWFPLGVTGLISAIQGTLKSLL